MRTLQREPRQDGPRELSFRDGTVVVINARVLVVWVGYRSGPWAVRSLRDAGYDVLASHPEDVSGGRSAASHSPRRYPSPADSPDAFLGWLEDTCRAERISAVLALDEDAVRVIAQGAPSLSGAVFAGPTAAQYRALCDKVELGRTAAAAGVDHPATVEVGVFGPRGPWPALPSIVKPRTSRSHDARAPVVGVTTVAERDAAIAHLRASGIDAVVQEQIIGQPWELHCVRADGGFTMVAAKVSSTYPRVIGTSSVSRIVPAPRELSDAAARLLDAVDYRGPSCMNLIERDGRFFFHDVNLRLAASVGAAASAGFDQPAWGVEAAMGHFRPPIGIAKSVTYLPLPSELAAFGDALRGRSGESPVAVARRIAHAVVARDHRLDPPLSDPAWLAATTGRKLHQLLKKG
jgi:hypothetical protein